MSRYPVLSRVSVESPRYRPLVAAYLDFVRRHRGRRTIHQLENALGHFCAWLDDRGQSGFGLLTASLVRDYVVSLCRFRRSTVAVHASALRGFFAYLRQEGESESDLSSAIELQPMYSITQPPQVLPAETVEQLLSSVNRSTPLGKRDLAMLLLAARYGLRSADIRGLRLDHVRWREQRIVLVQSKTQRHLELPLLADVEHALVSYLRDGRPACAAREIFVRHLAPISPLSRRNNLWPVMRRALNSARIEISSGERGLRLLRHCAATSLLRRGVRLETISDILGHASVDSTRRYAQVDLAGRRSVALSEDEVSRCTT
jgi:integrase/recombinase XerD